MGRGIGFIPNALICMNIDVSCSYESAKKSLRERDRESYLEALGLFDTLSSKKAYVKLHPFSHTEEQIWDEASDIQSQEIEAVYENVSNLKILELNSQFYGLYSKKNTYQDEWNSEYQSQGVLLCENDLVRVVGIQSTDNDVAIGVVMKHTMYSVCNDLYSEFQNRSSWYVARGLDWEEAMHKKAESELIKIRLKSIRMADDIRNEINSMYPIRFRTSPWTMSSEYKCGTFKASKSKDHAKRANQNTV